MRDVPSAWRPRLHELVVPEFFAMCRWIYHNGDCYTAVVFEGNGTELLSTEIVAWAVITWEEYHRPVLGAYTDAEKRKQGYGAAAVRALLGEHQEKILEGGGIVMADMERWPAYRQMVHEIGAVCQMWE